ncbi:MAG: valine--tRNA ligase [Clostridiales bacterium]|jgi:valyl-tRNA synthetase|nr:valine--tRNA ligase [Clostridiales bacterium]
MKRDLPKTYDPKQSEDRIYAGWLEKGYFRAVPDETREPFTIVIPPPNITGRLHMGHALDNTIQDAIIRFQRMRGRNALWLPGTDHAAIATETKIVAAMAEEGLTKAGVGREDFLDRAWRWSRDYGGAIVEQLKKLGSSCDWDRLRFTMDAGLSDAVLTVFTRLYDKGLIYRGERLVNWCPRCKTSISDAEVEHADRETRLWRLKYPVNELPGEYLEFATTRPETMLGDTAIAVNPEDPRYARLLGKTVTVPIVDRVVPIIADEYVDMEFGVGVVKITPGHDHNDFEVGARHSLPIINILNDDGTLNNLCGPEYEGLTALAAREKIVADFGARGLFAGADKYAHSVGVHDRCGTVVEPLLKKQWFVRMAPLAEPAIEALRTGELRFVPERFGKIYLNWLTNIKDWCVSRQLWWGHRIPAYYCADCGHIAVSREAAAVCPKCGSANVFQDPDTLDTWFSSALWPFSTLGWPEETADYKYFYPTSVLVTSYDIIFFWVVRMVFSGIEQTGRLPFRDVLIHGLIRDEQGRKFSKSLGNGVDPLDIIDKYGADALRYMLITGNAAGTDIKYSESRLLPARNFLNKLWNAARFILMNSGEETPEADVSALTSADKWILSRTNAAAKGVTQNMEAYDLGVAAQAVNDFIWDELCDWYIEMVKPRLYGADDPTRPAAVWTLRRALTTALKLLHPFAPFITEEIFTALGSGEGSIMTSKWPEYDPAYDFAEDERDIGSVREAIKAIRDIRQKMGVAPGKKIAVVVVSGDSHTREVFERGAAYIVSLGGASSFAARADKSGIGEDAVSAALGGAEVYIPLADLIDKAKEIERLTRELKKAEKELALCEGKLNNPGFSAKAPEALIAAERGKREKYTRVVEQINERIGALNG